MSLTAAPGTPYGAAYGAPSPASGGLSETEFAVFREFPYLYDGDPGYEARYLQTYVDAPDSLCVLALDGDRVVGASTGLPLADEGPEFRQPFVDRGIPVDDAVWESTKESTRARPWGHAGINPGKPPAAH